MRAAALSPSLTRNLRVSSSTLFSAKKFLLIELYKAGRILDMVDFNSVWNERRVMEVIKGIMKGFCSQAQIIASQVSSVTKIW